MIKHCVKSQRRQQLKFGGSKLNNCNSGVDSGSDKTA
jgi:hypothetical protein